MQFEGPTAAGLMYSDTGGDGPVVVLLHGVLMNGTLWDDRRRRPGGSLPLHRRGVAVRRAHHADARRRRPQPRIGARHHDRGGSSPNWTCATSQLVCNDWGGAQLVISPGGTDRVANLVLVSCEAFDNYPPGVPGRLLCLNAALPGGTFLTAQLLRPRWIRHLPVAFGALSKRRVPDDLFRSWLHPLRHNRKVRRDLNKYLRNVPKPKQLLDLGRPAALVPRPGPHRLGTTRQTHAPHPRRTPSPPLPEHTTRVDRRHPNPHPHRPARGPDRTPPHLPRHARVMSRDDIVGA